VHRWYACCVFFFFQAEDGIRDFHVTGVQTCALPILLEEQRQAVVVGEVVDDRDVDAALVGDAEHLTPDAPETVDADLHVTSLRLASAFFTVAGARSSLES